MLTLRPKDHVRIVELIRQYFPDVDILAYGSRVRGDCHDASDLDLALRARDGALLPGARLTALLGALRESRVPIIVEVRDWAALPEEFQAEIAREYEPM